VITTGRVSVAQRRLLTVQFVSAFVIGTAVEPKRGREGKADAS
jgi:hypothetical protein